MYPSLRSKPQAAFLLAIILAMAACVGDGYIRVHGVVTNPVGTPLPNATVSIDYSPGLTHTVAASDTGCFELGITAAPYRSKYHLTCSLLGFQPVFFTAHSAESTRVHIVLTPESSRANSRVTVEATGSLWPAQPCATPTAPQASDPR